MTLFYLLNKTLIKKNKQTKTLIFPFCEKELGVPSSPHVISLERTFFMSQCFKGFTQLFVKFTHFPHPGKKSVYVPFILTLQTGNQMTKFSEMSRHLHSFGQTLATRSSGWEHNGHKESHRAVKLLAYLFTQADFTGQSGKQGNNIPNFPPRCLQLMGKKMSGKHCRVESTVFYFDFCHFFAVIIFLKKSVIGRSEL